MSSQNDSETTSRKQLQDMIDGFKVTQLIYVVAKLGIADLLEVSPKTSEELGEAVGAHPRNLYRVLRALASLGIFFEDDDGRFQLTPLAKHLRSDVSGSVLDMVVMHGEPWVWRPWGELLHNVKTGEIAFDHAFNTGYWAYFDVNPEARETFNQYMTTRSGQELASVLVDYDFSGISQVVDMGGGQGTLITAILQAHPHMQGILFDLPDAVEGAGNIIEAGGVGDRCEIIGGDFFEAVPVGGDAYILQAVIHNWEDTPATAILKNCRMAIGSNGRLIIVDSVIPTGNDPFPGKIHDILMMVSYGALERTEAEFRQLLDLSSFKLNNIIPAQPRSVIEAVPV